MISEPQQTREFFKQGREFYHSQKIQGVRVRDIITEVEMPGIRVAPKAHLRSGPIEF
ncbi:hypothetical protein MASR2M15_11360 [Anaerolineales bacterium]